MPRRPSLRQQIGALLDQFDVEIRQAFAESIADIKSRVVLRALVDRLQAGDIDGALAALALERAAFAKLEDAIARAYSAGGTAMVGNLPTLRNSGGAKLIVRFDVRNQRAEAWLSTHSSRFVTGIIEDQRNAIRAALRAGLAKGLNPNTVALDLVGRINKATGRRAGGLLGLTSTQAGYVATARDDLLSGDAARLRAYLARGRRDKRFDRTVLAAIRDEKPIPADMVSRMVGRYSDSLLQLRGETIARTEALSSLNAASHEAFRQGLEKTNYGANQVIRTWDSAGDKNVRDSHAGMDGQKVKGLDTPFVSLSGALMLHPGDTSLGAGPEDVINCRCVQRLEFDYFEGRA